MLSFVPEAGVDVVEEGLTVEEEEGPVLDSCIENLSRFDILFHKLNSLVVFG